MKNNTREEPFLDLTDNGQYQVRINIDSRERGLELLQEIKDFHHQLKKASDDGYRRGRESRQSEIDFLREEAYGLD